LIRFLLIRLLQSVPVLLAIYTITFVMIKATPGSPFDDERKVPPAVLEKQMEYYGYGDSLLSQYVNLLYRHITFDFPPIASVPGLTSGDIIKEHFGTSIELGLLGMAAALLIGIPAGILASWKKNTVFDYIPMSLSMTGICLPTFVIGPILALVFALQLKWTPVSGWFGWEYRILPALTLGLFYSAYIARMTRGGMLEVLGLDYIRTARAKGLSNAAVVFKHALRGGIMPVVSFLGPAIAGVISGSFVVETIFQVPGLGRHFVQAALNRDHSLIVTTVFFYAILIIVANIIVDIVQIYLNPKLRYD